MLDMAGQPRLSSGQARAKRRASLGPRGWPRLDGSPRHAQALRGASMEPAGREAEPCSLLPTQLGAAIQHAPPAPEQAQGSLQPRPASGIQLTGMLWLAGHIPALVSTMEDAWVVLLVLARHVGGLLRLGAASGRRGQAAHHRRRTASDGGLVSRVVEVTRTDRVVGSQATVTVLETNSQPALVI